MEKTGMSYPWVMKYLPDKYKAEPKKGRRSRFPKLTNVKVLRRRTGEDGSSGKEDLNREEVR